MSAIAIAVPTITRMNYAEIQELFWKMKHKFGTSKNQYIETQDKQLLSVITKVIRDHIKYVTEGNIVCNAQNNLVHNYVQFIQ